MREATKPDRVHEGKKLIDQGERLTNERPSRPFFCRTCGREQYGFAIPVGWYTLTRCAGALEAHHRLGIYCSIDCLAEQLPGLTVIAERMGDRWLEETARYRQRRTR